MESEEEKAAKDFKKYFITWAKGYYAALDNYKHVLSPERHILDAKETIAKSLGLTVEEIENG